MTISLNSAILKKLVSNVTGVIVIIAFLLYAASSCIVSVPDLLSWEVSQNADIMAFNVKAVQGHVEALKAVFLLLSVAGISLFSFTQGITYRNVSIMIVPLNAMALYISIYLSFSTSDWCSLLTKTYNELIEKEKESTDKKILQYKNYQSNVSKFQSLTIFFIVMSAIEMLLAFVLFVINFVTKTEAEETQPLLSEP